MVSDPAEILNQHLQSVLPGARVKAQPMPLTPQIQLLLLDPEFKHQPYSQEESQRIMADPPYWCFCWASGQVLAAYILQNPDLVKDCVVVDMGSGSGIVAVAAALSGAKEVIACDIDTDALDASRANAMLNGCEFSYLEQLSDLERPVDKLFAADVLYDLENRPLLGPFLEIANEVWVADSRVKQLEHAAYEFAYEGVATTLPDYGEFDEYKQVKVYRAAKE